jgi:hypothetical protein
MKFSAVALLLTTLVAFSTLPAYSEGLYVDNLGSPVESKFTDSEVIQIFARQGSLTLWSEKAVSIQCGSNIVIDKFPIEKSSWCHMRKLNSSSRAKLLDLMDKRPSELYQNSGISLVVLDTKGEFETVTLKISDLEKLK